MKERPILFSGPMVRALLNGTKTQTRRIIKPQPSDDINELHGGKFVKRAPYVLENPETGADVGFGFEDEDRQWNCPYGRPGDRLWVRETFGLGSENNCCHVVDEEIYYRATDPAWDEENTGFRWKPSIHMPRWASRLTLEITAIRVERLNDISEEDAMAEGCAVSPEWRTWSVFGDNGSGSYGDGINKPPVVGESSVFGEILAFRSQVVIPETSAQQNYSKLWKSINGPNSWALNPWVWVIEFKRL